MSVGTITRILELQKGSNFEGKSMNEINGVLELQEGLILKEQVWMKCLLAISDHHVV